MDSRRSVLGLEKCLKCSDIKKYSSHTVYPHKTGGYVQPVSSEQSDHLKKLDRRRVGGNKTAKGIFADNSWDRWLNEYYNPKPKRVFKKYKVEPVYHKTMDDMQNDVVEYYMTNGYNNALKHINYLFTNNQISLLTKSQLVNKITTLQEMPKRLRKWAMKIN